AGGMTQTELAGDRFSKEYVSQIERGKTRPTPETIKWLANRLGVDAGFLANGVSADERGRVDAALARADALLEARRNDEALAEFEHVRHAVLATGIPELEVRALSGEATIRMRRGEVREAIALLERARALSEAGVFSDVEREDVQRALELAEGLNDKRAAADLYFQASIIADREGHWVIARNYAERAKSL